MLYTHTPEFHIGQIDVVSLCNGHIFNYSHTYVFVEIKCTRCTQTLVPVVPLYALRLEGRGKGR